MSQSYPLNLFHEVKVSPWPILSSMAVMNIFMGLIVNFMCNWNLVNFLLTSLNQALVMALWWRDVSREARFEGEHSSMVSHLLKMSMVLFILSEVMFFVSFFWAFFHLGLNPSLSVSFWPPDSIQALSPFELPLLNTLILLSSGVSITISHHKILLGQSQSAMTFLKVTLILGVLFTLCQGVEYWNVTFNYNWSAYSSIFFMGTMFHGSHVLVGSLALLSSFLKMSGASYLSHIGLELSVWYWHFVDVIWIFLFSVFYWWSYY